MAKAIALAYSQARSHVPAIALGEYTRVALVTGCGMALVLAGPFLPV